MREHPDREQDSVHAEALQNKQPSEYRWFREKTTQLHPSFPEASRPKQPDVSIARSGNALRARYAAQRLMDAAYAIDLEHGQQTEQLGGAAMGRRVRQVERFLTMLVPQVRGMASGEGLAQRLELFVAENLLAQGSE